MIVLREYEDLCNTRRPTEPWAKPHRCVRCPMAAPTWVSSRVQTRDSAGGVIHEYRLVA